MQVISSRGKSRRWNATHTDIMKIMHAEGAYSHTIAAATGFDVNKVKDMLRANGLVPHQKPPRPVFSRQFEPPAPKFRDNPLDIAEQVLPGFDRENMRLRGTPIKFHDLMREANRQLKELGRPQWTGDDSCVVK